jgi:small-conductance mechanosensitive channel
VASIGIRSSVLQMWDGTDTLIPNSVLLENNLTNWTYSSRAVRFTVSVGVSYGSDPKRVIQLLAEIAGRHEEVEKDPKPQVLFTNFGTSTLDFELRFWVDVTKASSAQVASDLRQRIVGTFAEQGLVMAFPQQDVHLDSGGPFQVQLVSNQGTQPSVKTTETDAKSFPVKPAAPAAKGAENQAGKK